MESNMTGQTNPAFQMDAVDRKGPDKLEPRDSKPSDKPLTEEEKREKYHIMKNILIISFSFMLLFTSFNSMANLQSSINKQAGTAALTVIYLALIVSCLFLPTWLIKKLKVKYTIAVSMICYPAYIAAQFYPTLATLVPTALLVGLGAAPLWSSKCTYLTKVGTRYAQLVGEQSEVIITRFFGIFFLFFQSTQVWGNLISSTVLSVGVENTTKTEEELLQCGYNFCPGESPVLNVTTNSSSSSEIPDWQRYTMASIYLILALLSSLVILIFVDPLSRFVSEDAEEGDERSGLQLLVATFNHMRHPYQPLVIPLTIWSGVEQAFMWTDYTAAYVSCGIGVHFVGYVMICYGVCDSIGSLSFSPVVKLVGRVPVFTMGFLINLAIIIALMYWQPTPDDMTLFFVLAGLWGVSDAVWQTQINAFYGVIFPGAAEAAFSNYRLWESLGFTIAYFSSTVLCINAKITILLVFLALGSLGYYTVEVIERRGGLRRDSDGNVVPIDKLITEHK